MESQLVPRNKMFTRSTSAVNMTAKDRNSQIAHCSTQNLVKDYCLDKAKSLNKKKESCSKIHMKSEMKPGRNLVIEFSTAAYELGKLCLSEIIYGQDFPYSVEKREGIDQEGATVDRCYKIYNTKADGSCGKILNLS